MEQSNAKAVGVETVSALGSVMADRERWASGYAGLYRHGCAQRDDRGGGGAGGTGCPGIPRRDRQPAEGGGPGVGGLYLGHCLPRDAEGVTAQPINRGLNPLLNGTTYVKEVAGALSQGMVGPVWRILVRAIPASASGIIPQGRFRSMIPAARQRPAPRCSEDQSVTNPRISA